MKRAFPNLLWPIVLLTALSASAAEARVVTVRTGPEWIWQRNRETGENTRYAALLSELSYKSPAVEISLDLPLRWESENWELDRDIWSRKGDTFRPVNTFMYRPLGKPVEGGLELFHSWTPGMGYLVRSLSGAGEIDYELPGPRFLWSGDTTRIQAGSDRPVDPAVTAVALTHRFLGRITVSLEGAVDLEAPLSFSGVFKGGRPVADETEEVRGEAAGLEIMVRDGDIMDLSVGGHMGRLGEEGEGIGSDLSLSFDFSPYYRNRLFFRFASVICRSGYVPGWFDGTYPLQRWGTEGQPLLSMYPLDGTSPDRRMGSLELGYDLGDIFGVRGGLQRFDDRFMEKAWFDLTLSEEAGRGLEASAWSRADGPDEKLFTAESSIYTRVRALYDLTPHFLLNVSFVRSWAFKEEQAGLVPLNSAELGLMYNISF